jgi:hypothetical protein
MLNRWMRTDDLIGALFAPGHEARAPWLTRAWIGGVFLGVVVGWGYVLGWGSAPLNFHDWTDINVPRLMFLQNALRAGEWPLHMGSPDALHGVTDRFFALPDVITTPQSLLLLMLPVPAFVTVDTILHATLGLAGLLLLRRYLGWSLYTWTMVALLFIFNGHILAHYTVGHFTWGPYFLFPFVFLALFRFLDGDTGWRLLGGLALLMFYMVLAGGQHHMTWVFLFLIMLAPVCGRRAWWPITAVVAAGLLGAVRLLPPALELQSFRDAGLVADVIGYPSVSHLLGAMLLLRREQPAFSEALPGNLWFFDSAYFEFSAYVGVGGALVVAIFGGYQWLRGSPPRYWQLLVPTLAMIAMSIGTVYRLVRALGIPLFDSERYTARMFSLPVTLLIIIAGIYLDRFLRERVVSAWQRAVALIALAFVAIDIAANVRLSTVIVSAAMFGPGALHEAAAVVARRADPLYTTVLTIGLVITMLTGAALLALGVRDRPRPRPPLAHAD